MMGIIPHYGLASYLSENGTKGSLMNTTIELLGSQHQEVLAHLEAIEHAMALSAATGDIADFVSYLECEVMDHFVIEEQALFPVLARHIGQAQGPLAMMDAEHSIFRQLLAELGVASRSRDIEQQQRRTQDITDLLRAHIAKEDQVLFPMAAHMLSPQEHAEVDARAAALRRSATAG